MKISPNIISELTVCRDNLVMTFYYFSGWNRSNQISFVKSGFLFWASEGNISFCSLADILKDFNFVRCMVEDRDRSPDLTNECSEPLWKPHSFFILFFLNFLILSLFFLYSFFILSLFCISSNLELLTTSETFNCFWWRFLCRNITYAVLECIRSIIYNVSFKFK